MTDGRDKKMGTIVWTDLTVENAEEVRDFYTQVVGWEPSAVSMGEYDDFNMCAPADGSPVAGVCHARGVHQDLPPQWLVYVQVADVGRSAERCREMGGTVLVQPRDMGEHGRYCVIQDPAGAVAALIGD